MERNLSPQNPVCLSLIGISVIESGQVKTYTAITDLSSENIDATHAFINYTTTYSNRTMEPQFHVNNAKLEIWTV